ncbi:MAG: hypothetical protein AB1405_13255 [Bdellovibrionota bacterium]
MTGLHILHFLFLCFWGGVVFAESAMELVARKRPEFVPAVARFHYWIDLCIEGPLLVAVLVTGGLLLRGRPMDGLLLAKIAAGLTAVAVNLYCVVIVVKRAGAAADPSHSIALGRQVILSAVVGVPFGLAALYLGALRAGWI